MSNQNSRNQNNDTRDKKTIESDIHDTRYRLDQTLTALQDRLAPKELMNETFDYFRHGGPGQFTGNLGDSIKNNPVPFVLTTIGLGWLMLAPRSGPTHHDVMRSGSSTDQTGSSPSSSLGSSRTLGQTSGQSSSKSGALDAAKDKLGAAGGKSRSAASSMRDSARGMKDSMSSGSAQARERSRAAAQSASRGARNAGNQAARFVEDNPLAAAGIGIGIGIALGGLFPASRLENEQLGDMRDDLVDKASEAGADQADKLRSKVDEKAEQSKPDSTTSGQPPKSSPTGSSASDSSSRSATGSQDSNRGTTSSTGAPGPGSSGTDASSPGSRSTSADPARPGDAPPAGARQTPGKTGI